ncbi:hypothetical protein DEU56DRAFT_817082 [Suillus clintonianus]|uniref:uncharacterized protein n=1 Tax=Suillus clintonianus TaxID=1904413 RepID=UPI001B86DDDB|nr:uncharacterized protein DEU56DRAFT_817082 [Suillus clintonianus]KAG2129620.1 hypothetical protein DEU56DRAFT_817082 [Suillus clintonianus]
MSVSPTRPSSKRIKLESSPSPRLENDHSTLNDDDLGHDHCVICLQPMVDRTVIPTCSHEFCFECISIWAEQSRKCPLCSQLIGEYVIHHIRSQFDYQKHYLPPPRSSPQLLPTGETRVQIARRARRDRYWGRRDRYDADELERAITKRRWVYQNHLYAKHVASNSFTRYRPYPSPAQFAASPDMISRATIFLRRELRVWQNLDVEFLTTFIISLMKSIDMRAESSVKLLAEFLDLDTPYIEGERQPNAEHFAHEIYCYIRSGRDLSIYDSLVQYDTSPDPPSHEQETENRWRYQSRSRSRSPHHRHHRSRSRSPLSQPPSSTLRPEHRRSPSPVYRQASSLDYFSPNHRNRRRTRSAVSECRDIPDTSNDQQSHLDDTQEQPTNKNKSAKAKGKEPEVYDTRYDTPLQGESEHRSSSTPPRILGEFVPNAVVEPKKTAESHTPGNRKFNTPSVESGLKPSLDASTPAHVPVDVDRTDVYAEPVASTSRKRPNTLGRPPRNRTLLASVQAHLSQPTSSRNKRPTDTTAQKHDVTPQQLPHPSRHRDARDSSGDGMPVLLSQLSSPANAPPTSLSSHSSLGKRSDASMPLAEENTSAVGNQRERERVRSLPADPIAKGTDEENKFAGGKTVVRSCGTPDGGTDKYRNKSKEEEEEEGGKERHTNTSPCPIIVGPGAQPALSSGRPPNPNSNPISLPHNSNHVVDAAEHTRRDKQEVATYEYRNRITAPSARTSTDMRAVLLQRLEEGQRLAQRGITTSASTSHSALPAVDVHSPLIGPPGGEEASALETRLRTRALLRVRLAAIKSSANTTLIES